MDDNTQQTGQGTTPAPVTPAAPTSTNPEPQITTPVTPAVPAEPIPTNPAPQITTPAIPAVPVTPQAQAPVAQTTPVIPQAQSPVTPTTPAQPATQNPTPQAPQNAECYCPELDEATWDKKTVTIEKTFLKTWSPRVMFVPVQFAIDLDRLRKTAAKKNLTIPPNAYVLDKGAMFMGSVMIEVEGATENDKDIVSLKGKNLYSKISKRPWKEMKLDMQELVAELGKTPAEVYTMYSSCPKCVNKKEIKSVLLAVV